MILVLFVRAFKDFIKIFRVIPSSERKAERPHWRKKLNSLQTD